MAFTSCSSDKNIESKGDYEKISFEATGNQNFKPIEHQKYLLKFNNLGIKNKVNFILDNGNTRKKSTSIQDNKVFYVEKSENGFKLMTDKDYLEVPVSFYDSEGNLIKRVEPFSGSRDYTVNNMKNTEVRSKQQWLFLLVVLCCVEVSYSYSSKEGHSFSAGFDCNCLN